MLQPRITHIEPPKQHAIGGGLEGAERTTRETALWSAPLISPDQQINPVKQEADARSRDSIQNDGYATGAVATHRDSIVGSQYRLNAQPDTDVLGADDGWAEEFQVAVESKFNLLADSEECWFDASGKQTFTGIIRLGVGSFLMSGEILQTVEWIREQGRPFSTAFQSISPNRLSNPNYEPDTAFQRAGIKIDFRGKPLGYWIKTSHPGEFYMDADPLSWRYVEARKPWGRRQVIHIIEALQPDQTRGISDMVAVLKQMRMTRKFQDVTLQNAVVNATYAAAVESELPKEMIFGAMGAGGAGLQDMLGQYMTALHGYVKAGDNIAIDGVKMPHLFPGTKLNLRPMGTPGGVGTDFEESLLRHTAAALGLSYEQFSKDYSKTNYSSARASMGETWKYMQGRKKMVADRQAKAMYTAVMEEWVNAGEVPLPRGMSKAAFYDPVIREALLSCEWIGASRGQIDELKETQAAVMRMNSGLSTMEAESARLGQDYRRTLRQLAREEKLKKSLGLDFSQQPATKPGANAAKNTMQSGADDDEI